MKVILSLMFLVAGVAGVSNLSLAETTHAARAEPTPHPYAWQISTSPMGLLADRYNLQFGHFLSPDFLLSVKGTIFKQAPQSIFGKDDGHEIGLRGAFFQPGTNVGITGQFGAFYSNFRRGDFWSDVFTTIFTSSSASRDEIKGPMIEGLVGMFLRSNQIYFELLGGMEFYSATKYLYNTSTGARTELSSGWDTYLVIEANVGLAF